MFTSARANAGIDPAVNERPHVPNQINLVATKSGVSMQYHLKGHYSGLNVVVTGADGFIGSHLTEALVRSGATVTALCLYNSFDSLGWIDDLPPDVRSDLITVRGD